MAKKNFCILAFVLFAGLTWLCYAGDKGPSVLAGGGDHADLVGLFKEFREFSAPKVTDGVPEYSAAAMEKQYRDLKGFQSRLASIDPSRWPVSEQIDYHLVRAEMNGFEFQHRVLRPWSLDPGFYNDLISRGLRVRDLPLDEKDIADLRKNLRSVPAIVAQAKANLNNLADVAGDLGTLAVLSLGDTKASLESLSSRLAVHHPELVADVKIALAGIDDFAGWIGANKHKMIAKAGVGKDNYNWLLKNVYLFPYTWDDIRTIVELEDNRVITFRKLEEQRNRDVPPLEPAASQEEYKQRVKEAIEHVMKFLREKEIMTVQDYLKWDNYYLAGWHEYDKPWTEKPDYFFNFSHREPLMEETHEMVGHSFDGQRYRRDDRPIRGARHPYKIATDRGEGFAFALEELLMHAGYLDGRNPHGREIVYEQAAFRTVRALSDVYMHSQDWSLADATNFCIKNAPHGELLEGSHHLWYELDTTLRGVGHHMLMVVGKVQFMKLIRDRAQQLGNKFNLKAFMDEFLAAGMIPMSLIRWEMTGYDDEIKKLRP
jgi:hypothetical protein